MKAQDSYVGLELRQRRVRPFVTRKDVMLMRTGDHRGVFTCSTSGHFRLTTIPDSGTESSTSKASLPMRLCDVRLSPDGSTLAYGGDEVDLSVWDVERTLSSTSITSTAEASSSFTEGKKRKTPSTNELLPAELWRAKNVRSLREERSFRFVC